MAKTYEGSCFCGHVTLRVTAAAVSEGYCHCASCQKWSATPVTPYMLFRESAVEITSGETFLKTFSAGGKATRAHCTHCGGAVLSHIKTAGLTDVYAPILPDYPFTPTTHVHYANRMFDMNDGLPKYADFSKGFGGTGEMIEE